MERGGVGDEVAAAQVEGPGGVEVEVVGVFDGSAGFDDDVGERDVTPGGGGLVGLSDDLGLLEGGDLETGVVADGGGVAGEGGGERALLEGGGDVGEGLARFLDDLARFVDGLFRDAGAGLQEDDGVDGENQDDRGRCATMIDAPSGASGRAVGPAARP
jgi:hypothetical protein